MLVFAGTAKALDEEGNLRTLRVYDHYTDLESLDRREPAHRVVELEGRTPLRPGPRPSVFILDRAKGGPLRIHLADELPPVAMAGQQPGSEGNDVAPGSH